MQTVTRDGVALHFRDEGPKDGRVVMFANSLGTDLRIWDMLLPLLPAGLRLVRYDKRGHGLSDCPPAPYSIEELAGDAAFICETLGVKDVTFVGLSIGGLIGQTLAAMRPDLVKALVIMDSAAKIGSDEMWNTRINAVRTGGLAALADGILERWFAETYRKSNADLSLWRNMLSRTPAEGYIGCCQAIAAADQTEATRALTLPVIAMAGDQDLSTPPELVRATAALCDAPFHLIPDAVHIPCVEQPDIVARIIADFLKETA